MYSLFDKSYILSGARRKETRAQAVRHLPGIGGLDGVTVQRRYIVFHQQL